jgi:hypothetical protein
MATSTIYLVKGFCGEYTDAHEWIEKAFFMKEEADEYREQIIQENKDWNALIGVVSKFKEEWEQAGNALAEFDKSKLMDVPKGPAQCISKKSPLYPAFAAEQARLDQIRDVANDHNRQVFDAHQKLIVEHNTRYRTALEEYLVSIGTRVKFRVRVSERYGFLSERTAEYEVEPLEVE